MAEAEPETVLFDVCNYSIIGDWIAAGNGEDGIKFQESFGTAEKKCDVSGLNCYEYSLITMSLILLPEPIMDGILQIIWIS